MESELVIINFGGARCRAGSAEQRQRKEEKAVFHDENPAAILTPQNDADGA